MTPLEDAADTLLLVGILAKRGAEKAWRASYEFLQAS